MRRFAFVVALGLLPAVSACKSQSGSEEWVRIRRDDLLLGVDLTGKLAAVKSDSLGPPAIPEKWEYKISTMAPEGAAVKKGDVVLAFDATELKRSLETKQNERDAAVKEIEKALSNARMTRRDEELRLVETEARLRKASLKLDRPTDLTGSLELAAAKIDLELADKELGFQKSKAAATKSLDDATLTALRDKLARAEARINETEAYIAKMTIGAPRTGTVIYISNWNDQKKKVGDSAWQSDKVLETALLDEMMAKGEVDEVDGSKTAVGQRISIKLDALPDVTYWGTVKSIGKTVQRQSRKNPLKVVRLDIALDKTDSLRMRPGMRFRGIAETERIAKALVIPTNAIFMTDRGPVAYRRTASGFETALLKLGKRNQDHAEVLGGIEEGDEVSRSDLARVEQKK